MSFTLYFTVASFPPGWSGDYNQFAQKLVSLLSAQLQGSIMPGIYSQGTITLPSSDQGPVFMNGQIYLWSTTLGAYALYNSQGVPYIRSNNILDNGDFQVWQRTGGDISASPVNIASLTTTTTTPSTAANYLADRWIAVQDGTLANTPTQQQASINILGATDRPNTRNCLRITANSTATPTISASQFVYAAQRVERQRAREVFDVTPSLSIWLRSSITGTFCAFIQNAAGTASFIMPCQITIANHVQKFTFPAIDTLPDASGGFGTNPTDYSLMVGVVAAAGANFQVSPSNDRQWVSSTSYCDTNQANLLATASATLDMTLAQFEPAPTVSAFDFLNFEDQLFGCQRFFWKSYDYTVVPGTALGGPSGPCFVGGPSLAIAWAGGYASFGREMRVIPYVLDNEATPVITQGLSIWSSAAGTVNTATENLLGGAGGNTAIPATHGVPQVNGLCTKSFSGFNLSGGTSGDIYSVGITASADL